MGPSGSQTQSSPAAQRHIVLDLHIHWFAAKPPKFPFPSLREAGPILSANYSWETIETLHPPGEDWTFIGVVQWEDDPNFVTKIRVRWNSANIDGSVRGEFKHIRCGNDPAPTRGDGQGLMTGDELRLATEWYGRHVFEFCEKNLGFTVDDGECWTLAQQALKYAGKQAIKEGHDPPMISMGRVHGQCILEWTAGSGVDVKEVLAQAGPAMGDVLEMADAHFRSEKMLLDMAKQMTNVKMAKHTAVVQSVDGDGTKLAVMEQNARVRNRVTSGEYDLATMVSGKLKIYRPVGQSSYFPPVDLRAMCDEW